MSRRKRVVKLLIGLIIGIFITQNFLLTHRNISSNVDCNREHQETILFKDDKKTTASSEFTPQNSNLLFVGVMTATKYLDSRAKAIYKTWGKNIPGRLMFFGGEFLSSSDLPVVALPGVDDSYPPQKKAFLMLKHMYDNYLGQYEWFMRADDDLYVKMDKFEALLRSVDSRKPWFIGQTGRGTAQEFGLLSLDENENYCMGGPGIVFSRETLRRLAPHIHKCLENLVTNHEDVELGRCVKKFAGVSCTWSYEASHCTCKARERWTFYCAQL